MEREASGMCHCLVYSSVVGTNRRCVEVFAEAFVGGKQNVLLGLQVLGVTLPGRDPRGEKRPSKLII